MDFVYTRVSTEEQGQKGWSLAGQADEIRPFCTGSKLEVYNDTSTGSNTRRPGLQEMLRAIRNHKGPFIVHVWRADRLSRSASDFFRILSTIERAGGSLHTINPNLSSADPQERFVMTIMVATAEWELSTIKQRTNMGLTQARKAGHHCGRPGVGFDLHESKLVLSVADQKALKVIADGFKKELSLRAIARALNEAGIPTKRGGKRWYASTVKSVLSTSHEILDLLIKGKKILT